MPRTFTTSIFKAVSLAIAATCATHVTLGATVSAVGTIANNQDSEILRWRSSSTLKSLDVNGDNVYGSAGYSIFKASGGLNTWNIGITEQQVPGLSLMQAGSTSLALSTATTGAAANWDNPLVSGGVRSMGYGGPRRDSPGGGVPASAVELVHAFSFQATANIGQTIRMGIVSDGLGDPRVPLSELRVAVGGSQANATLSSNPVNSIPDMYFFDIEGLQIGDTIEIHMAGVQGSLANPFSWPTINGVTFDLPFSPFLGARVDRQTGALSLHAEYLTEPAQILAYSLTSASGSLDPSLWTSISGHYDKVSNGGDGSVDPDDGWTKLTNPASRGNLSEGEFDGLNGAGNGATLGAVDQSIDLGNPWIRSPNEDLVLSLKLADGSTLLAPVSYTGDEILVGDLNFDGVVNAGDWSTFRAGFGANFASLTIAEGYRLGDLDGDGDNDEVDFAVFKAAFEAQPGNGSFAAMVSRVPEPSSLVLWISAFAILMKGRVSRRGRLLMYLVGAPLLATLLADAGHAIVINVSVGEAAPNLSNEGLAEWADLAPGQSGLIAEEITNGLGTMYWNNLASGTSGQPLVSSTNATTGLFAAFSAPLEFTDGRFDPILGADIGGTTVGGADGTPNKTLSFSGFRPYQPLGNLSLYALRTLSPENLVTGTVLVNGVSLTYRVFQDGADIFPNVIANATGEVLLTSSRGFAAASLDTEGGIQPLTLQVNTVTGSMAITNTSNEEFDIDFLKITSPGGSLSPSGWSSLMDQDFEGGGPPSGNGDGWEDLGVPTTNQLVEAYLQGSSSIAVAGSVSLGAAYNTTTDARDVMFVFRQSDGTYLSGDVVYVNPTALAGDYNEDGVVNLADYTVWRDNLGADLALPNEGIGVTPGQVTAEDYGFWKSQFGTSSGAGSVVGISAVPEPATTFSLCGILLVSVILRRFPTASLQLSCKALLVTIVAWAVVGSSALAAVTNDRLYSFGEDSLEGATHGGVGGSNNSGALSAGNSADSTGPSGAYLDLTQSGDPTYQEVGPGGLQRPGVSSQEFGVRLGGSNDRLTAIALNRPDNLAVRTDSGTYPINYSGIASRGVQMWVYPTAGKLGSAPQTILADSALMGGPQLSADGRWTQLNSGHSTDGTGGAIPIRADTPVAVANTWYHVMHHVYNENDPKSPRRVTGSAPTNHEAVLYVNGIAVSANFDNVPASLDLTLVIGAEQNGEEYKNHFQGVIDDVEMYVFGNNETGTPGLLSDGENWGTFDLFADNEWIAREILTTVPGGILEPGDVNKDGMVNQADVDAFVDGWLSINLFDAAHGTLTAGDWNTWDKGDMNHDGITDLDDAFILHGALLSAGMGGLNFSLLDGPISVPEPSAFVLGILALGMFWIVSRRWA
jgi:hypothetical protein